MFRAFLAVALGAPAFLLWEGRILAWFAGRSVLQERELLADADAYLLTQDSEGLACALAKIETVGAATPGAHAANAHLFIIDPIRLKVRWWNAPVIAHPPVEERIAALQSLAAFPPESLERARAAARQWAAKRPKECGNGAEEADGDALEQDPRPSTAADEGQR